MGIFNAALIWTGEIHASRTAAAAHFSEHSPVSRRKNVESHPYYDPNHNHDYN